MKPYSRRLGGIALGGVDQARSDDSAAIARRPLPHGRGSMLALTREVERPRKIRVLACWTFYRLNRVAFFAACRSSASSISRSISFGIGRPECSHIFGYMLIEVKPGMVLISLM